MTVRHKVICAAGVDSKMSDVDGLPYSTLLYGNGPGFSQPRPVPSNSSSSEMAGRNSVHGAAVPRQWATHGGEDVPIYAQVRYAHSCGSSRGQKSTARHVIISSPCRYLKNIHNITFLILNTPCILYVFKHCSQHQTICTYKCHHSLSISALH
jgi:hypothetical protein